MKFTISIIINQSIEKLAQLISDNSQRKYWQKGFNSYQLVSGTEMQQGAKAIIKLKNNNTLIVLHETILENKLPQQLTALYEHKHMINTMTHHFSEADKQKTIYSVEIHYTKFIGIIPKLMALFMPSLFRKQIQQSMESFKIFAEQQY